MSLQSITPSEVFRLMNGGEPGTLIDVRTPAEFAQVHVPGALSIPLDTLDPARIAGLRAIPSDPLYVICQSGGRAARACERLDAAGLGQLFLVEGGTAAWEAAGLPVDRPGGRVISLERQVRIAAGAIVFATALLGWAVHPLFLLLTLFVGAGLVFAGITDFCGMAVVLGKMPWNRAPRAGPSRCGGTEARIA